MIRWLREFPAWGELALLVLMLSALLFVGVRLARGETITCAVSPGEPRSEWHYRTKVPGWVKGAESDRCWYRGPAMKPRDELRWPAPDMTPLNVGASRKWNQWDAEPWRRRGAAPGWEHKE